VDKLAIPALARLYRGKELIADNLEVTNLKRGPQDVKEVLRVKCAALALKPKKEWKSKKTTA
jgi:hypothetical protein